MTQFRKWKVKQRFVISKNKDFLGSDSVGLLFSELESSQEEEKMESAVKAWKRNGGQEERLIEERDRDECKC